MKSIPCADVGLERQYLAHIVATGDAELLAPHARVSPADFCDQSCVDVALDTYALADAGERVDAISVPDRASRRGLAAKARAIEVVLDPDGLPLWGDLVHTAVARLRRLARARRLRDGYLAAVASCEAGEPEQAARMVAEVAAPGDEGVGLTTGTAADAMIATLESMRDRLREGTHAYATGYQVLDDAITGLRPRTLMVIGGGTNAGKSQLCLGMACNMVDRRRFTVGIVSCEDEATIWGERLLALESGVDVEQITSGSPSRDTLAAAAAAVERAKTRGLHFAYALNRPLADVLFAIRSLASKGCRVIMVDYLQAVALPEAKGGRYDLVVKNALQSIKGLTQSLGVALVVASQFSRPEKAKPFAEPFMTSLKESSALEQSAEVIALLWKTGDGEDAQTLGKVAKVKWSGRRPRFVVERSPRGMIAGLHKMAEKPKRGGYADVAGDEW